MEPPIVEISGSKVSAVDNQEILCVPFLGSICEIERSRDNGLVVNNHHLVVSNSVNGIDHGGNGCTGQNVGGGAFLRFLAFVEKDLNPDAAHVSPYQRLSDGYRGEGVSLDQHRGLCIVECLRYSTCGPASGREVDLTG